MISSQPSSVFIFQAKSCTAEKPFCDQDQTHLKRCHVLSDSQHARRSPLDPLSDRRNRASHSPDSAYHSLLVPSDLRALLPEQPVSVASRPSGTFCAPVCSWPPPVPRLGPSHSTLADHRTPPSSSDSQRNSSRAFLDSTSTWNLPETQPVSTIKPSRKPENLMQSIRLRTNSMPSVRRPPGELWRSDPALATASLGAVDSPYSTPPGLAPRQPDLRRGSCSELHTPGSLSLSLALGSQPLRASEHTKAVPPIGAERSRAVSTTPHRNSAANQPTDHPWRPTLLSPRLQAKWNNNVYLLDTTSLEKAQAVAGDSTTSKEDLERLLRHAVRNKYAPRIISPLSPLRSATTAFDLSTDPEYQLRMPSPANNPSSRYSKYPLRRIRTVCDSHQLLDLDTTCMHCEECKRDTVSKRLLAFRHCQLRAHHAQRTRPHTFSSRGVNVMVGDDDRIALASRIREVYSYAMDEEEKSLWEDIAAVTGAGPLSLTRVGTPCATSGYRRVVDDGTDVGMYGDYMEFPDDGLRATESVTLFRDVTVY